MTVCTPYIHKNGKIIYASSYGLKAFCFEVTKEEHEAYLAKKRQKQKEKTI
ncbi:MAG: hypothetical protein RR581_06065 [Eubacterium sp.]